MARLLLYPPPLLSSYTLLPIARGHEAEERREHRRSDQAGRERPFRRALRARRLDATHAAASALCGDHRGGGRCDLGNLEGDRGQFEEIAPRCAGGAQSMRAPSKGAVPGASIRGGARSVSGRCGYTPVTTRPDKARSLAWLSSSRCEKTWARTRVVHIVTCGVRVASWCACTRRVQCGMWLVGCCLFKACVMRHAVLCRSTRCVVNRQSSRPVCREHGRESCFDFRLRTPRRCVWPPSRAWSRERES